MVSTKNSKWNLISILGLVIILTIILVFAWRKKILIEEKFDNPNIEKKETIALITKFKARAKACDLFYFVFKADTKVIYSKHYICDELGLKNDDDLRKYELKRFKVLYVVNSPEFNRLLLDKPVK